jgi:hypothetical protein
MKKRMNQAEKVAVLNRLLHVLCRSLPMYLADARPWARGDQQPIQEALSHLVADQQQYAGRVAQAIVECGFRPDLGRFPMQFTAINDVSLDFLVQKVIELQRRDITAIEHCAAELTEVPPLCSLAEEILGNARGHLEILEEMTKHL